MKQIITTLVVPVQYMYLKLRATQCNPKDHKSSALSYLPLKYKTGVNIQHLYYVKYMCMYETLQIHAHVIDTEFVLNESLINIKI